VRCARANSSSLRLIGRILRRESGGDRARGGRDVARVVVREHGRDDRDRVDAGLGERARVGASMPPIATIGTPSVRASGTMSTLARARRACWRTGRSCRTRRSRRPRRPTGARARASRSTTCRRSATVRRARARPPGPPSCSPTCTPSASTRAASAASSLTIASAPRARHSATIARACASASARSASLWRYWIAAAPPSIAAAHFASSASVSAVSGVTA
jgi:hypothetical protein